MFRYYDFLIEINHCRHYMYHVYVRRTSIFSVFVPEYAVCSVFALVVTSSYRPVPGSTIITCFQKTKS